jgi:hypothetical protein
MANEKRLIDANALMEVLKEKHDWVMQDPEVSHSIKWGEAICNHRVCEAIEKSPTVDAVEMPKGKPGDYLEWDNGTGIKQIYCIHAVMICKDCMRYDLEKFSPVVDHPNIVRILSLEEAEQEWREMCAKAMPREEPTMTAVCGERKDND